MSSGGAAIKTWLVAESIGAIEELKDQGVARWNGPRKLIHNHAKTKIVSSYNKAVADRSSRSLIVASKMVVGKYGTKTTKAAAMKVMDVNCFGGRYGVWRLRVKGVGEGCVGGTVPPTL